MNFAEVTDLQVFGRWAEVMQELAHRELIGPASLLSPTTPSSWSPATTASSR
jgi:hypothetical protein